jgi:hypothetical protein
VTVRSWNIWMSTKPSGVNVSVHLHLLSLWSSPESCCLPEKARFAKVVSDHCRQHLLFSKRNTGERSTHHRTLFWGCSCMLELLYGKRFGGTCRLGERRDEHPRQHRCRLRLSVQLDRRACDAFCKPAQEMPR